MKKIIGSAVVVMLMSTVTVFADGTKPAVKHHAAKHQTTCSDKSCKPSADCKPGTKCPMKPGCVCH